MTFALVSDVTFQASGGSGGTTAGIDTTGASLLVCAIFANNGGTITPSDSNGNTWTLVTSNSDFFKVYRVQNPTVGAGHTFTITGNHSPAAIFAAFSGAHTSSVDDLSSDNDGIFSSSLQPGSITPSGNNFLVVTACATLDQTNTPAVTAPFSSNVIDAFPASSGNYIGGALAYEIQTTATARNPTWSNLNGNSLGASIASFEVDAGQTVAVGQVTETDLAQPVAWAPKRRLVGQASETDLAQPITPVTAQIIAVGQASETDLAQPVGAIKTLISAGTVVGSTAETASDGSIVITTTVAVDQGDLIVVRGASDNLSSSTPTFTVADSGGNTYATGPQAAVGASAAGVAGFIAVARAATALGIGATITVTLSGSVAMKAVVAKKFPGASTVTRSTGVSNTGSASSASTVTSGTVNQGDLVVGGIAAETRTTPSAYDTDTTNGSWSAGAVLVSTTGGTDATRVEIVYQDKITTAAGTQTYNVTIGASTDWVALVGVFRPRWIVEVHQVTETDEAQPVTVVDAGQSIAVGQASETDLAQPVTRVKARSLGQASETDLAQSVTARKTVAVGQISETDLAQPVAWAPKRRLVAQISETDLAQPVTARKIVALGQATESDLAQPATARKTVTLGQTTETDAAQLATTRKTRSIGQVAETDLAQPITVFDPGAQIVAVGQASEADEGQPVTARKTVAVGQTTETDLAQPIAVFDPGVQIIAVGQSSETDLAQPITARKTVTLGQASTTDLAQALSKSKSKSIGQTSETDLAQALARILKVKAVGLALEIDEVFALVGGANDDPGTVTVAVAAPSVELAVIAPSVELVVSAPSVALTVSEDS
jgi:hypothetical protein